MSDEKNIDYLERAGKTKLAYIYTPPAKDREDEPCVVFCGGFRSDMMGTKAEFLEAQCKEEGRAFLRLDYSGHGYSGGQFETGTVGSWRDDVVAVLDHLGLDNVLLVGSSMGGWIAMLIARDMPERVAGLVGVAAAPDFTEDLYHNRLIDEQRKTMQEEGKVEIPNEYSDEPYVFTKALIDDGKYNLLLHDDHPVQLSCPVHLLQGKLDEDVPWQRASEIKSRVEAPSLEVTYIPDGDHRLSRDEDLALLWKTVNAVCAAR